MVSSIIYFDPLSITEQKAFANTRTERFSDNRIIYNNVSINPMLHLFTFFRQFDWLMEKFFTE